jgi:hypothetical protein
VIAVSVVTSAITIRVHVDATYGCELAQGRTDGGGYVFHGRDRAHRVAWVAVEGPIPEGMVLDHMCRRPRCVALHHLELVTPTENEHRKKWSYRCRIARCRRGHSMLGRNGVTVMPEAGRVCRTCNTEARERASA